jgi:CRISPR-associated protein Cas1
VSEPPPPAVERPPRRRRVQAVTPTIATALGRALSDALQVAGRESLVVAEPGEPVPPTEASLADPPAPLPSSPPEPAAASAEVTADDTEPDAEAPPRAPRTVSAFRRTLYIQEQGAVLARQEDRLVVKKGEDVLLAVPAAKVDQVFVLGRCSITTPAMTFCLQEEIPIVLLSSRGQYYGVIDSPTSDRVSLHRQQFARAADPAFVLATAKAVVRGKLANCRVLLQRHQRRKGIDAVKSAIRELDAIAGRLATAQTPEAVLGHEGNGAARYFDAFARLLQHDLGFRGRVRRPPTDPVNSLLSFGYTLAFYNVYALIRGRGLHPYVGHLHSMRDRHPALASDLLEEFRAPIVDSLVLYLVNSKLLTAADFYRGGTEANAPCLLRDGARKTFLKHFEQRLGSAIVHPRTEETVDWRRAMDIQVAHMAQWIRGEVSEYRPMEIR